MATFPNVPDVPGVPPLNRAPGASTAQPAPLTGDSADVSGVSSSPQWGVFLDGIAVVTPDTFAAFEYRQDWSLSDYPVEQGGFQTFNKVNSPFDSRVRLISGGSETNRQTLLDQVANIAPTLDLYDIVTPEVTYNSVNVTHYDYRRTSRNGVGLIVIDLWFLEVRATATAAFAQTQTTSTATPTTTSTTTPTPKPLTQTQAPSGTDRVNDGTVQTVPPTPAQEAAILNGALAGFAPGL